MDFSVIDAQVRTINKRAQDEAGDGDRDDDERDKGDGLPHLSSLHFPELLDAATAMNNAAAQTWTLAGRRDNAQEQALTAKNAQMVLTGQIVQFAPKYARN